MWGQWGEGSELRRVRRRKWWEESEEKETMWGKKWFEEGKEKEIMWWEWEKGYDVRRVSGKSDERKVRRGKLCKENEII